MYDFTIIGGGASGLVAAIKAKKNNPKLNICILEGLPRVGKKILATGNGRCNITNFSATCSSYNNPDFTKSALNKYTPKRVVDFFEEIGLKCVEEAQGRVYPMTNNASSVLDVLRFEIEHLGIEVITEYKVKAIKKSGDIFIINNDIKSKKILLSTGGKASPSQGSDGSGFDLLQQLGHRINKTYPGLVQLKIEEKVKALKGVRVKADVSLYNNGKKIDSSVGEVLFTDYGLSGIAIMDVSRSLLGRKCTCELDVLPQMSVTLIDEFIANCRKNNPLNTVENVLSGMLPRKLARYILQGLRIEFDTEIKDVSAEKVSLITDKIKHLKFTVTDTTGFNNAQITVGGADTTQFDKFTMESNLVKGLFCSGEIFDVDAPCGGFNLQWAWASGLTVGDNF